MEQWETTSHGEETLNNAVAEKGLDGATLDDDLAVNLTPEHREYLLSRHKTLDVIPLPTMYPANPLNWPT
jgi:hypothetical protein